MTGQLSYFSNLDLLEPGHNLEASREHTYPMTVLPPRGECPQPVLSALVRSNRRKI